MMQSQHRRSYLAPPAPQSLKETTQHARTPASEATPRTARSSNNQAGSHHTPTSGVIPLNISNDVSSHGHDPTSSRSTSSHPASRNVPFLSLEHLSLETKDVSREEGRQPSRGYAGEPRSAIDPPSRPFLPRAMSSSHKSGLHTSTLPMGAAPPPSGPLPPPPASAGESWRNQYKTREMT
jgi:mitogen-activated protein kinase kinase